MLYSMDSSSSREARERRDGELLAMAAIFGAALATSLIGWLAMRVALHALYGGAINVMSGLAAL